MRRIHRKETRRRNTEDRRRKSDCWREEWETSIDKAFVREPEIVGGERMGGFNQKGISISMPVAVRLYVLNC